MPSLQVAVWNFEQYPRQAHKTMKINNVTYEQLLSGKSHLKELYDNWCQLIRIRLFVSRVDTDKFRIYSRFIWTWRSYSASDIWLKADKNVAKMCMCVFITPYAFDNADCRGVMLLPDSKTGFWGQKFKYLKSRCLVHRPALYLQLVDDVKVTVNAIFVLVIALVFFKHLFAVI